MKFKRILSALIGFPLVAAVILFGNIYTFDILIAVVACLCLYEYNKAFSNKYKPMKNIGYIFAVGLAIFHLIPVKIATMLIMAYIPIVIIIAFVKSIIQNEKFNVIDIAITILGIVYTVGFLVFLSLIYNMENGKILIWYVLFSAWGSDTFAYLIGKKWGKHKLCKISPNKTIEGSIAGVIGAIIINVLYTTIISNFFVPLNFSMISIIIMGTILSIIGQIGDLAASTMKRHNEIKDFSKLIPGHGGMLDRIDSVIFIAPIAYLLLTIL